MCNEYDHRGNLSAAAVDMAAIGARDPSFRRFAIRLLVGRARRGWRVLGARRSRHSGRRACISLEYFSVRLWTRCSLGRKNACSYEMLRMGRNAG